MIDADPTPASTCSLYHSIYATIRTHIIYTTYIISVFYLFVV